MSALAELWHIVRKDVRQSKWLLGAFVLLAIAATIGAASAEDVAGGKLQLAAVLMIAMGPIVAASIVQADSPIRADAFWASKPFRPPAMLAAKLVLVVGVLLLIPLLGQWLALIAFRVPADERTSILIASAGIYGFVLLIAMFLAALTPELRSFVLAVVALLLGFLALGIAMSGELGAAWGDSVIRVALFVAGLVGVVSLIVLLYLRRGLRWGRALGVVALTLVVAGRVPSSGPPPRAVVTVDSVKVGAGAPGITVEMRDTARIRREGRFRLRITLVGASGNQRYRLDSARARFFLHNGGTTDTPLWVFGPTVLRTGKLELPGVPTVHDGLGGFSGPSTSTDPAVLGDARRVLTNGIDSMQVTGILTMVKPQVFATIPLRKGASVLRDGQSLRVTALNPDGAEDFLHLSTKVVGKASSAQDWTDEQVGAKLYLINGQRHEGIAMQRRSSSYNAGLLVLPGASVQQGTINYQLSNEHDLGMPPLDRAWLQGASLMLISWDDGPSLPVRASSVPLPPESVDSPRPPSIVTGAASAPMRAHR